MANVELMPLAHRDLQDIWDFLSPKNMQAAVALFEGISRKLKMLQDFPEMGSLREGRNTPYRVLISGRYNILYRYADGVVTVLRIVHGARNLKKVGWL